MSLGRERAGPSWQPAEAGAFLLCVALPLIFTPFSAGPFVEGKLLVLAIGALLLALARPPVERRTAVAAAVWVAALALTSILGLDPWWSIAGSEDRGMGFTTLAVSAFLLCAATGIPDDLRSRIPTWIFGAGIVVSVVAVLGRFVQLGDPSWGLGSLSSTLGQRVFVGGFVAASALAATAVRHRPLTYVGLLVVGSGLAVSAVRSAWVGAAVALAVVAWRGRDARAVARVLVPVILAVTAWTAADRVLPEKEIQFSAAPRFAELDEGSAEERLPGGRAYLRAWANDPILGSGPATGWNGYLQNATTGELRVAGRGFSDAHNIVLELAATTGAVGVLAFIGLAILALRGAMRAGPDRSWALGVTVVLAIVHLFQPLNLVLTPLAFFSAGLAIERRGESPPIRVSRWFSVALALVLVLAIARLGAASFQRYGALYASEEALRWALRLEPRRMGATLLLAEHRAFDHRAGDRAAAAEARDYASRAVHQHAWSPRVRLEAVNVELVLDDEQRARAYVEEQLELFPRDAEALNVAAILALRRDDAQAAAAYARRSVSIDPDNLRFRGTLEEATS